MCSPARARHAPMLRPNPEVKVYEVIGWTREWRRLAGHVRVVGSSAGTAIWCLLPQRTSFFARTSGVPSRCHKIVYSRLQATCLATAHIPASTHSPLSWESSSGTACTFHARALSAPGPQRRTVLEYELRIAKNHEKRCQGVVIINHPRSRPGQDGNLFRRWVGRR